MKLAGTESWEIRWGDEFAVNVALYLRDALALSVATEPEIPLLTPSVPVTIPDGVDRAAVTKEWPGWWAHVLSFARAVGTDDPRERFESYPVRPESPALAERPAIRAAVAALQAMAGRHFSELRPRGAPPAHQRGIGDIVRAREAELGRKARPFRLVITEIPVGGLVWHRLREGHVLVSARFVTDIERCDAALREVITELA